MYKSRSLDSFYVNIFTQLELHLFHYTDNQKIYEDPDFLIYINMIYTNLGLDMNSNADFRMHINLSIDLIYSEHI